MRFKYDAKNNKSKDNINNRLKHLHKRVKFVFTINEITKKISQKNEDQFIATEFLSAGSVVDYRCLSAANETTYRNCRYTD